MSRVKGKSGDLVNCAVSLSLFRPGTAGLALWTTSLESHLSTAISISASTGSATAETTVQLPVVPAFASPLARTWSSQSYLPEIA